MFLIFPICCFCRQTRCSCQVATVVGASLKTLRCLMGKSYMWKCPLPCLNIYTGGYVKVSFLNNHTFYLLFLRSNYTHSILVCLQTPSGPIQTRQVRSRHQANTLVFFVVRQPFQASCTAKRSNGFLYGIFSRWLKFGLIALLLWLLVVL